MEKLNFLTFKTTLEYMKTRQDIATEYGICTRTLMRRLKDENVILPRGRISPKWQSIIYEALGPP